MIRSVLILLALVFGHLGHSCSCFGPQTFCGTLDPQPPEFPEPEWWIPDAVILGVKLAQEAHGMDVQVLETIAGAPQAGDILRVWGDCGLLCRVYPDAWEVGDTVIWALRLTDLMGNGLCGTNLEQEGEYMISICGTYYLDFDHGMVTGPITEGVNSMPYMDLVQFLNSCGATGVVETTEPVLETWVEGDLLLVRSSDHDGSTIEHSLFDLQGRMLAAGTSLSDRISIPIQGHAAGVHLLRITHGRHSEVLRLYLP